MKIILPSLIIGLVSILAYLAVEGGYAISRGSDPGWSIGYQLIESARSRFQREDDTSRPGNYVILRKRQFDELIDDFQRDGVALGSSPFGQLRNENVAFNFRQDGCLRQKPNLDKTMVYLRTILFESFNPPNAFFNTDQKLSPAVAKFIETYGIRRIRHRTNGYGERVTEPFIERPDKVLVSGDSVANGAGVFDSETIASNLQRLDSAVQYVNVGVGGAEARDIICNLETAAKRYVGQIRRLVYVYCENDLKDDEPFGQPEDVIAWLSAFARDQRIDDVMVVFAPYIFNVFPDVTRVKGDGKGWGYSYFSGEKERLRSLVSSAGFKWLDIAALANEEVEQGKSMFAGLSLYIDRVHLSPKGSALVAQRILSE